MPTERSFRIALTWLGGLTFVLTRRVREEEGMLIEAFGAQYRRYIPRTGRFLPRVDGLLNLAKAAVAFARFGMPMPSML